MAQMINARDLDKDIRNQMNAMSDIKRRTFMKRVIGHAMYLIIQVRFLTAKGPDREVWKSSAADTKLGGKFAASYKKRPSGRPVSASSLRLSDTGEFKDSYRILKYSANDCEVGPLAGGKGGKAKLIAERAENDWKNHITGWDRDALKIIDMEIEKGLDLIARGISIGRTRPSSQAQIRGKMR